MPRGAEMSLIEPILVALHSNSNTTFKHAPQVEIVDFVFKKTNGRS
jgi:hypothetical protein